MQAFFSPKKCMLIASLFSLPHTFALNHSAFTQDLCFTKQTSISPRGPIPTKDIFYTITLPQLVVVTTTPGSTITPSTVNSTSTISTTVTTVSDVPQATDTFTDTISTTYTSIITLSTATITKTSTTSTTSTSVVNSTTTIAKPAGFTPIQDSLPDSVANKRRGFPFPSFNQSERLLGFPIIGLKPPPSYPVAVTCVGLEESFAPTTLSKTAETTTTVTGPTPTSTISSTITITSVSVFTARNASAQITKTVTASALSTVSPSATITTTTTVTLTAYSYTATAYAACANDSQNFAGTLNNRGIATININSNTSLVSLSRTADNSSEGCCTSCLHNPFCSISFFDSEFAAGQKCYNAIAPGVCTANEYGFTLGYSTNLEPDLGYIFSNGNCGIANKGTEHLS